MRLLRGIASVLAAVIAGGLVVLAVETLSGRFYPPPPGVDHRDPQALGAFIASMPLGAYALLVAGWALAAFLVGWIAARLAAEKPMQYAWIAGGLFFAAGLINLFGIPHPTWFRLVGMLAFLPFSYLGGRLGGRGRG